MNGLYATRCKICYFRIQFAPESLGQIKLCPHCQNKVVFKATEPFVEVPQEMLLHIIAHQKDIDGWSSPLCKMGATIGGLIILNLCESTDKEKRNNLFSRSITRLEVILGDIGKEFGKLELGIRRAMEYVEKYWGQVIDRVGAEDEQYRHVNRTWPAGPVDENQVLPVILPLVGIDNLCWPATFPRLLDRSMMGYLTEVQDHSLKAIQSINTGDQEPLIHYRIGGTTVLWSGFLHHRSRLVDIQNRTRRELDAFANLTDRLRVRYDDVLRLHNPEGHPEDILYRHLLDLAGHVDMSIEPVDSMAEKEEQEKGLWSLIQNIQAPQRLSQQDLFSPMVENKPNKNNLKEPPPDAIAAYRLRYILGKHTQEDIATKLTQMYRKTYTQGWVSKWLKYVKKWIEAGNILPNPSDDPRAKASPVDPGVIERGVRQDGLAKRQREKMEDDE